jgi:hypothetical protein
MSRLTDQDKRDLLLRAQQFVTESGGRLQRSEWNHVLKSLFGRGGEPNLERTKRLVDKLPTLSWLATRSGQTEGYLEAASNGFKKICRANYSPEKLRFLLGWIERILRTAQRDDNGNE